MRANIERACARKRRRPATAHYDSDTIFHKEKPGKGQLAWLVHLTRGGRCFQIALSDATYGSDAALL
ncbi:hypothetical protein RA29_21600, partial [Tateyamaria sp. ANG-S1]